IGLGNLHAAQLSYEEAAACYRAALAVEPKHATALANLGVALHFLGDAEGAMQALDAALALEPEHAAARWARALACIPVMRDAETDLGRLRTEFGEALVSLDRWFAARPDAAGHAAVGTLQPFWIAYQAEDNVALLSSYGRLCSRLMENWLQSAAPLPRPARKAGPLRVGIVSRHLRRHSIWSALIKGWMQGLDRERFALYGFSLGTVRDAQTRYAESRVRQFVHGPRPLRQWVDAIREAQPDVLIYPEIGIDATTIRLASLRLAPLQATSWGHPETSGLPTIDCYLSAQDFEPEAAAAHYSERLIALPHLGSYLEPGAASAAPVDLARWGLAEDAPLLVCPGTPFKYAPEFDRLFPAIARRLGRCRFVFFQSGLPGLSDKLRQRLAGAFVREGLAFEAHVSFVPWMPQADFHALMRRADAMLDTLGFSGFNTALQAMECGLPVVTREGRFLRGRLASGVLKRTGVPELVAADEDQYVALAVRLAQDRGFRAQMRQRIEAGRPALFGDRAPLRALEEFLAQGV
ncbi:MAG: tetratricopeptide repeat protein, partial [Burkholderiales bacterium]